MIKEIIQSLLARSDEAHGRKALGQQEVEAGVRKVREAIHEINGHATRTRAVVERSLRDDRSLRLADEALRINRGG